MASRTHSKRAWAFQRHSPRRVAVAGLRIPQTRATTGATGYKELRIPVLQESSARDPKVRLRWCGEPDMVAKRCGKTHESLQVRRACKTNFQSLPHLSFPPLHCNVRPGLGRREMGDCASAPDFS